MKIIAVILSVLILQIEASFYDDITGAMSSVEDAFGKLLNDVVSDVKNTVHCTILAMEQVLVISGAVDEPTTSDKECPDSFYADEDKNSYKIPVDFTVAKEKDTYLDEYSHGDYSERIHSTIAKVNKTLNNIFDNDGHERLRDIKKVLKNETDRLTEVSRLLRQELDKISYRIRNEMYNMNSNQKSLESLWDDMKLLHEIEMRDKNVSEVNEISHVLNEAMGVLNLDSKGTKSDDDKMKVIMQELEQESLNNTGISNSTVNKLYKWDEEETKLQNSTYETSKANQDAFKEAARILTDKDNGIKEMLDHAVNETAINIQDNKASAEEYKSEQITPPCEDADSLDLDYLSMLDGVSTEEREKVIDHAKDIIKDGASADVILDKLFSNQGSNSKYIESVFNDQEYQSETRQ